MFGERMKEQREFTEPRLRQEDVGKILGMSQRKISRLEKEDINGLFMRDIIREEVTPDDARLR